MKATNVSIICKTTNGMAGDGASDVKSFGVWFLGDVERNTETRDAQYIDIDAGRSTEMRDKDAARTIQRRCTTRFYN